MNTKYTHILILVATFFLFSCKQQETNKEITTDLVTNPLSATDANNSAIPVIEFEKSEHDFGKISQGEKVSHSFKFKNTGKADLLIASAQGSCGCTVPTFSDKPIVPGAEGTIDVIFDSEGKEGKVSKTITVVTNSNPSTQILKISTEIIIPTTKNEK
ncbi:MAG: DUF1573 domain-containing protein [Bacteroidetes bacterium]|nr:DUF1573 domain-containing protein [Bacteroidota bacterium]